VIIYNGSSSNVIRWISSARHEFLFARTFHAQVGAEWNHIIGNIPNYENGQAKEDRYDFTASVQKKYQRTFFCCRKSASTGGICFSAPFLPYLGTEYEILKSTNQNLKIRGSISKNYRVPTLNDRYWQNAGDKNLLPEASHAGELGVNYQFKTFEISSTFFSQKVDNWIQWVPDALETIVRKTFCRFLHKALKLSSVFVRK